MAAQPAQGVARVADAAAGAPWLGPLPAPASRRWRGFLLSLVFQIGLWVFAAWMLRPGPTSLVPAPFTPARVTWLATPALRAPAPRVAPPPARVLRRRALAALARRSRGPRPRRVRLAGGGRLTALAARADPAPSPRARPLPAPGPEVAASTTPQRLVPLPPQPAAAAQPAAKVRIGAFSDGGSPAAAPAGAEAGPSVGAFGTSPGSGAGSGAEDGAAGFDRGAPRLGAFAVGVAHPATAAAASEGKAAPKLGGFAAHPARREAATVVAQPGARAAGAYVAPVILSKPRPQYTALARARGLQGIVLLRVVLTAEGRARVLGVVRGLGDGLDESARAAVARIRFLPARRGGRAVDATVLVRVSFRLAQ